MNSTKLTFTVPVDLAQKLKHLAQMESRSQTDLFQEAIRSFVAV